MSKNERVMDYLLDRIEVLEKEKRDEWFQKTGLSKGNEILQDEIKRLKEKIDDLEMEKEHIKEIITCNLDANGILYLSDEERDHETLMGLLDIKPEDYEMEVKPDAETKD